jgi:hypothetical protein
MASRMRDRLEEWESAGRINQVWANEHVRNTLVGTLILLLMFAPQWLPLRAEYRVQQSSISPTSGSAVLLTTDSIETALQQMEDRFRQNGFEVSRNLMNHDDSISTAILNASHTTRGHFALITLSRSAHGTRIELSFSEKIAEQK